MTEADFTALRAQLMEHEGLRLRPYVDTVGKVTIGIGRNLTDKGITAGEAMTLLDHDIDECLTDLRSFGWFNALDAVRQRALIDLRFNVGRASLRGFVKMLAALAAKDYPEAARQLITSAWANQVQPARRDRLMTMLSTGVDG